MVRIYNLVQGKNIMSNLKQYKQSLSYIKKNGKVLGSHVQTAIVSLGNHVIETGDWSKINELRGAVVNTVGLRVKAFDIYVNDTFTGMKFDKETQLWLRKTKKKPVVVDAGMLEINWFEYTKEAEPIIDYDKRMQGTNNEIILNFLDVELKAIANKQSKNAEERGDKQAYCERIESLRQLVSA